MCFVSHVDTTFSSGKEHQADLFALRGSPSGRRVEHNFLPAIPNILVENENEENENIKTNEYSSTRENTKTALEERQTS